VLDLLPTGGFLVIIVAFALVVAFFFARQDRRSVQLGITLAVGGVCGLLLGFCLVFWRYFEEAQSFADAWTNLMTEEASLELRQPVSIHRILGATAGSMLLSWLSLLIYRRFARDAEAPSKKPDQVNNC
jgi:hypothetical protein